MITAHRLKVYYELTKPGIIRGNLITTVGGFLLAAKSDINFSLLLVTLLGIGLIIASACVFNNYIDRSIDSQMQRTKKRALVQGTITAQNALLYATALGFGGLAFLSFTNLLTVFLALVGFIFYVVVYAIAKRRSSFGTVVGSVSGAIPIVVGYCSVTGVFDLAATILFLIMVTWQMPHFYAIAIYRLRDYQLAKIPVLPAQKGLATTKTYIVLYIAVFSVLAMSLTLLGYTGFSYLLVILCLSIYWMVLAFKGFSVKNNNRWAGKVFEFSLIVMASFSVLISIEAWLP